MDYDYLEYVAKKFNTTSQRLVYFANRNDSISLKIHLDDSFGYWFINGQKEKEEVEK